MLVLAVASTTQRDGEFTTRARMVLLRVPGSVPSWWGERVQEPGRCDTRLTFVIGYRSDTTRILHTYKKYGMSLYQVPGTSEKPS